MTLYKLSDVCTIRYGKDHKKLGAGQYPVYGSGGVMRYVDSFISSGQSVLIPRKGTLDNLFYSEGPFWTVDTLFWTDINKIKVKPKYLYYLLKTKNLAELNIGTAVPSLSVDVLNEIDLEIPELKVQGQVVTLLDSIELKIRSNNQLNDYLEELLNLEFEKRFGQESNTIALEDVLDISTKSVNPQNNLGQIWEHYSIPAFDETHWPIFEFSDDIKSNKYLIDDGCILISKLNPSIKRVWFPACLSDCCVCSTEFIVYKPKETSHASFYRSVINSSRFTNYLLEHVTGSTGSRQRTQPKSTFKYQIPFSGSDDIENYCSFADPIYLQIAQSELEMQKLKQLQETLLPKLMSGEIDVSRIDLTRLNNHLVESFD